VRIDRVGGLTRTGTKSGLSAVAVLAAAAVAVAGAAGGVLA
jgi:hypothetical protein